MESGEDWFNCPDGAIIVIDECQRVFRPRATGSHVPEYVSRFETHRHHGHDVFLITQHPMLLDSNVCRLVGCHRHYVRAFGAKASNQHEWGEARDACDKNRSGSVETFRKYPKEVFAYYKSAELHTHRFRIPTRVIFLVLAPFIIFGLVYWFYTWWKPRHDGNNTGQGSEAALLGVKQVEAAPAVLSAAEYVEKRKPRLEGLLHTAPVYDEVTKPVDAPIPVGCVDFGGTCRCYTQQGTRYETTENICRNIVAEGMFFVDWKRDDDGRNSRESRDNANWSGSRGAASELGQADTAPFVGSESYQPPELSASPVAGP